MLASLLPGLRDVRVPLAVGYLWLTAGWLVWADDIPRTVPTGSGPVAHAFQLVHIFGRPAIIAVVSFLAYVLGALLTLPVDNHLFVGALDRVDRLFTRTFATTHSLFAGMVVTGDEYRLFLSDTMHRALLSADLNPDRRRFVMQHMEEQAGPIMRYLDSPIIPTPADAVLIKALSTRVRGLRVRLLVANQELYGEYDRYAAEAAFRINLVVPTVALGMIAGIAIHWWWTPLALVVALVLLVQGVIRLGSAVSVIRRAVVVGIIEDPLVVKFQELIDSELRAAKLPRGPEPGGNREEPEWREFIRSVPDGFGEVDDDGS